jgi:hypothetical protein
VVSLTPEIADPVGNDASKPSAESSGAACVLELGQVLCHGNQHVLHQVVGIRRLQTVSPQPPLE